MRPTLSLFAVTAALATSLLAAQPAPQPAAKPAPAQGVPVKQRTELSAELREFRKTAIPVQFPSNGLTLHGWIYKPQGTGPFPAVVWNHGSEQEPTAHPDLGKFYTSHGFVLFLPVRHGHRPSPGEYIQDVVDRYQSQALDRTSFQRKVVELQDVYNEDVVAAITWIKEQPFVDKKHIVVTGCSYGGIQTLLTAEQNLGVSVFVSFAPAAMSWANVELQKRLLTAVRAAKAPVFLLQAENDYNLGPSEVLGPVIRARSFLNRAKVYPAFGTTHQEGMPVSPAGRRASPSGVRTCSISLPRRESRLPFPRLGRHRLRLRSQSRAVRRSQSARVCPPPGSPKSELGENEIRGRQLAVAIASQVRLIEHRQRPETVARPGRGREREVAEQLGAVVDLPGRRATLREAE